MTSHLMSSCDIRKISKDDKIPSENMRKGKELDANKMLKNIS